MTSIVFTFPKHLNGAKVANTDRLYPHGKPKFLRIGDHVYVCHNGRVISRATVKKIERQQNRPTLDGGDKGKGWVVEVGRQNKPRGPVPYQPTHGFRYLWDSAKANELSSHFALPKNRDRG